MTVFLRLEKEPDKVHKLEDIRMIDKLENGKLILVVVNSHNDATESHFTHVLSVEVN